MLKTVKRYVFWASMAVSAAAVVQELMRPQEERQWHGSVFGVPYDFRPPNLRRSLDAWWNPSDPRIFTPRGFGVGWAINMPRLMKRWQEETEQDSDDGA